MHICDSLSIAEWLYVLPGIVEVRSAYPYSVALHSQDLGIHTIITTTTTSTSEYS